MMLKHMRIEVSAEYTVVWYELHTPDAMEDMLASMKNDVRSCPQDVVVAARDYSYSIVRGTTNATVVGIDSGNQRKQEAQSNEQ